MRIFFALLLASCARHESPRVDAARPTAAAHAKPDAAAPKLAELWPGGCEERAFEALASATDHACGKATIALEWPPTTPRDTRSQAVLIDCAGTLYAVAATTGLVARVGADGALTPVRTDASAAHAAAVACTR